MIRTPVNRRNKPSLPAVIKANYWILFVPLLAGLTYASRNQVFFWDTVQFAGKHGLWFFEHDFSTLLLPAEIDSGHPPVFGWYLATVWKLFGKSLATSHWAMFPFLVGIVWQLSRLARQLFDHIPGYWLLLIALSDPVLLGQSLLVSPDIALVFFFLWAVNCLLREETLLLAIACTGLAAVSTRGMMMVAAFGAFEMITHWSSLKGSSWSDRLFGLLPFLPAAIFSFIFLLAHYRASGWIGYHPDSPWAPSFGRVDAAGFLRNGAVFLWRWLDFGRLVLWLGIIYLWWGRPKVLSAPAAPVLRLLISVTALLSISFFLYTGLQAHRYLLPAFLLFSVFVLLLADRWLPAGKKTVFLWVMLLGLLSGNLWVYPDRISQGWDATAAHWPYYSLRDQALAYLKKAQIPLEEVGTAFPDIGPLKYRDLSGTEQGFKEKDLDTDRWILYSNVMNDFSDAEIEALHRHWVAQMRLQWGQIYFSLYRRPTE